MQKLSIFFAGDNFARVAAGKEDPYEFTRPITARCDAAFCNLETVLTDSTERAAHSQIHISSSNDSIKHLTGAGGYNAVTIANNHCLDFGRDGLVDTISALDNAGISHTGAGISREDALRPAFIEANGHKVAFIGMCNTGSFAGPDVYVVPLSIDLARESIAIARDGGADIIIVSPHWGYEFAHFPCPEQQILGRALIDAGADLVVGHHPHVIQGMEKYEGKRIFYSLGNYNFFQFKPGKIHSDRLGYIAKVDFHDCRVQSYETIPYLINELHQPVPITDEVKLETFRAMFEELSDPLSEKITWQHWMKRVGWNAYRHRLRGWITSIRLAKGIRAKFVMTCRFGKWMCQIGSLRWLAGVMKSFLFHSDERYSPPSGLR